MKTLTEFTYIHNTISDNLRLLFEYDKEVIDVVINHGLVFENDGTFKLQLEIAKVIYVYMLKYSNDKTIIIRKDRWGKIGNIFFNELVIHKTHKNSSYYDIDASNIDNTTNKFDVVHIYVDKSLSGLKLFRTICHEVMHAWQDYKMQLKGLSISSMKSYKDYDKMSYITGKLDDNFHKFIPYHLKQFEQNAYLSEIVSEVKEYCRQKKVDNYDDVIKYVCSKTKFAEYVVLQKCIEQFSEEDIKKFETSYNKLYNTNEDGKTIIKKYYDKLCKFINKTYHKIAIAYFDYIEECKEKIVLPENMTLNNSYEKIQRFELEAKLNNYDCTAFQQKNTIDDNWITNIDEQI